MRLFLGLLLCSLPGSCQDLVNTVAGSSWSFSLGPTATQTPLGTPPAIAVDSSGNVYFTDSQNNLVFRLNSSGVLTILAGTGTAGFSGDMGPATSAQLNDPEGIAVDSALNVYVADRANHRVRVITAAGMIATVVGTGVAGNSGDKGPASQAQLNAPKALALSPDGTLYIGDGTVIRSVKLSTLIISSFTPCAGAGYAVDALAVDKNGALYTSILNQVNKNSGGTCTRLAGDNVPGYYGDGLPSSGAEVNHPMGLAVDGSFNVFIADTGSHRVREISNGVINTIAGNGTPGFSGDGTGTGETLSLPSGVAVDAAGNLYIADTANGRIRKLVSGQLSTIAGNGGYQFGGDGGPAVNALLNSPHNVAVDLDGGIIISDTTNHRVRKMDPSGVIHTIAGTGTAAFLGDGGPATQAALNQPLGIAVDRSGNLYIADSGNLRIRQVAPNGTIRTVAGVLSSGIFYAGTGINTQIATPSELAVDSAGAVYFVSASGGVTWIQKLDTSGNLTVFAGDPFGGGSTVDNIAATAASISVRGLAIDANNNVYFSDASRVRYVDANVLVHTVAGNQLSGSKGDGGPALQASLSPSNLALDNAGNLYVNDQGRIRVINSSGVINAYAGSLPVMATFSGDNGPALTAQFSNPNGLAADAAANLYIADTGNNRVRKTGARVLPIPSLGSLSPSSANSGGAPFTLTVNGAGFVAGSIICWNGAYRVTTYVSSTQLQALIAASDIAGTSTVAVTVFNPAPGGGTSGSLPFTLTPLPAGPFGVTAPASAVSYSSATLSGYVNPNGSATSAWFEWTTSGTFSTFTATAAQVLGSGTTIQALSLPLSGLSANSVYFYRMTAQSSSGTVRGLVQSFVTGNYPRVVKVVAGGGTGAGLAISAPIGGLKSLHMDAAGNFYAIDTTHSSAIVKVSASGVFSYLSLPGAYSYSPDGTPLSQASVYAADLGVDATGNLYFAEVDGYIRKVGANGLLTTIAGNGQTSVNPANPGTNVAATSTPVAPLWMAVASDGTVYFYDVGYYIVRAVTPGGTISTVAGKYNARFVTDGSVALQVGIQVNSLTLSGGDLYLLIGRQVFHLDSSGIFHLTAGLETCGDMAGDGGAASQACLTNSTYLAADDSGNFYLATSLATIRKINTSGIINTIAGTGVTGIITGDGGPATAAALGGVGGLTADAGGDLFIASNAPGTIRKIDTSVIITRIAGSGSLTLGGDGGPATSALMAQPAGVAVDSSGNIFVSDTGNNVVRKVNPQGIITTIAGNTVQGFSGDGGPALQASLNGPTTLAVDASGNLFINDYGNSRIRVVNTAGVITTVAGNGVQNTSGDGGPATQAALSQPGEIALDTAGDLYIATSGGLRGVTASGLITTLDYDAASGVVVESSGNIAFGVGVQILLGSAGGLQVIAGGATGGGLGDGGPAISARLNLGSLTSDAAGNLYLNDHVDNFRIREINTAGIINTITGGGVTNLSDSDGTPALQYAFSNPVAIAADAVGNVYVADAGYNENKVVKITSQPYQGTISPLQAGGPPGNVVRIPVVLSLSSGASVDSVSFGLLITPNGSAAAPIGALSFQQASPLPAPSSTDAGASYIGVKWSALSPALSGTVTLGYVLFTIPAASSQGQSYSLRVSAAGGGLAGAAIALIPASPATSPVGNSYLVGDVYPSYGTAIGSFGDGNLNTLDLIAILRAVTKIGTVPAKCTDLFDAMDTFPADTTSRGGDGVLNTLDLIEELRRITNLDTTRPTRTSPNPGCSSSPETSRRDAPAGFVQFGDPVASGNGWRVPVYIQPSSATVSSEAHLEGLAIGISGESALSWQAGDAGSPTLSDSGIPGTLALAWLQSLNLRAEQPTLLGYVAGGGSAPRLNILNVSAHGAGGKVLVFATRGAR